MTPFSFDALRRHPDVEAENLFASDAADRLLLDTAAEALADAPEESVVVIGDAYGALTLGAAALHGATGIRVHQDPLSGEQALAANAERFALGGRFRSIGLEEELLAGARVVLLRLPKSLASLAETADAIARYASEGVTVFAGGMVKHMVLSMSHTLSGSFESVRAGRARGKARVLTVSGPTPVSMETTWPQSAYDPELDLTVCAHGGAFAGTAVDIGTRFLLEFLERAAPDAAHAIDLGCGTGVIATALARARPGIRVLASDQSSAAVASARATAEANGVGDRVEVRRDDALSSLPSASAELIVLNPPFHSGTSVHSGVGDRLIADAGRVLAPGGELWTVFNSHLGYRSALARVGETRQVARNAKFTVTVSTAR